MNRKTRWRRARLGLFIVLLTLGSPGLSFAEGDSKVGMDVGLKMWVATWQAPLLFVTATGDPIVMKTNSTALLGPTATIGFKTSDSDWFHHVWFNATYLTNGSQFDFNFSKTNPGFNPFTSVKADRQDVNLIGGVNVYGGLSMYMGYFGSFQDVTFTSTTRSTINREINAFVIGLSGKEALSDYVDLKGNAGFAVGSYQFRSQATGGTSTSAPKDLFGWSTEVGINFHTGGKKFDPYFYMGVRVQEYEVPTKLSNGQTLRHADITYGPMFQIGAQF